MAEGKNLILSLIAVILRRTAFSLKRFPLTIFYFLCFLITLYIRKAFNFNDVQVIESVAITFLVGAVLNMTLTALRERSKSVDRLYSAISFLGFFAPFLMFLTLYLFPLNTLWLFRSFSIGIILFLIFMIIPGYKRTCFEFDKMIIIIIKAALTGLVFSGFLFGGLCILIFTLKKLYLTGLSSDPYSYALYFCLFVFLMFFLGSIPSFKISEDNEEYIKAVRFPLTAESVLSYVLIPVTAGFTIMFLGYGIKILLSGVWPSNIIVRFVLIYSAAGIALYITTAKMKNLLCDFFRNFFPAALVIFNVMAAFSIYKRISVYSVTYLRYFGILAIFFSIIIGFAYILKKRIYLTATVFLFCAIIAASVLPIVNFYDSSCYFQMLRAQKILERNFMLESGILKPNAELTQYDMDELYNSVSYFVERDKTSYASWLPSSFSLKDFKKHFGFDSKGETDTGEFYYRTYLLQNTGYSISGFDMAINTETEYLEAGVVDSAEFSGKKGEYTYELKSDNLQGSLKLILKLNGNIIISNDFKEFTNYIKNELKNELSTSGGVENNGLQTFLPYDKMSFVLKGGGSKLLIVFHTVVDNRSVGADLEPLNSLNVTASVYFDEYA